MHWENKAEERSIIIDAFQMLFSNFHININPCNNWSIAPIIQISNTEIKPVNPSETKRLESQATLKGSVGGVQALLQIQQSVSQVNRKCYCNYI
jgi:hypothetical protein